MSQNVYKVLKQYANECDKEYHRFNSWRHCYEFFKKSFEKEKLDIEYSALNLGFYLASWGMYRGSTFLLQNNHKIHEVLIRRIKEEKLFRIENFNEIKCLEKLIRESYSKALPNTKNNKNISDTLITKIILGIYGCIPAYDRYFILGLKETKREYYKYSEKSFDELEEFYILNKNEFDKFNKEQTLEYPKMKLLDMYFWKIGFDS
ncbi:hypothetical protein [Halarcobacter sp.]|uniref:hypothetical protein n=1 Tax=Halarcobacter sp. TaxID=2321133 RepID=UPI003A933B83